MAGDQENLQKKLHDAMEKIKEGGEREKKLEEQLKKVRENLVGQLRNVKEELEKKTAELRKLSAGFPAEGSMKWEADVEKIGEEFLFSPYSSIGGLHFRIGCRTTTSAWLEIYLYCNDNSTSKTYSALVDFTLTIASTKGPVGKAYCNVFLPTVLSHGGLAGKCWYTIKNTANGFAKNGRITISAQIKVIYHYKDSIVDFTSPDPQFSDVTLLVEGRKFHANRSYLAIHCEYFKVLFGSDFAEKNKDEIKLEEINANDFEEMLHVIYPERKKPTSVTVKGLLHLADFFGIRAVQMECADFLMGSTDFSLISKLQLSEEFGLSELQYRLVESLKETKEVKAVIDSADFIHFSVTLQKSLLEKHYKLG